NPFEKSSGWGGQFLADVKQPFFGGTVNVEGADFQDVSGAFAARVAQFSKVRCAGDIAAGILNSNGLARINKGGTTQFRLYFELPNNTNYLADQITFFTDPANAPQLIVLHTGPNTQPADTLTLTGATLSGVANPNGLPTMAWFEWGGSAT